MLMLPTICHSPHPPTSAATPNSPPMRYVIQHNEPAGNVATDGADGQFRQTLASATRDPMKALQDPQ
jgi:hypothetical protein